jgi:hypothetical protein
MRRTCSANVRGFGGGGRGSGGDITLVMAQSSTLAAKAFFEALNWPGTIDRSSKLSGRPFVSDWTRSFGSDNFDYLHFIRAPTTFTRHASHYLHVTVGFITQVNRLREIAGCGLGSSCWKYVVYDGDPAWMTAILSLQCKRRRRFKQ